MNPTSLRIQLGRCKPTVTQDKIHGQVLDVAYGMGVDSTAVLVLLWKLGIRPDIITFADTGEEKAATYAYLQIISAWLEKVGFPPITIVKNDNTYASLGDAMLKRETLPSIAFGQHSCSQAFKASPQDTYMNNYEPAAIGWALGMQVVKAIGYDNGDADKKRCKKARVYQDGPKYRCWYPLQDHKMDREACKKLIESVGLPVPPKSSCVFCTAMHREEIVDAATTDPIKMARALKIEATWLASVKHGPLRLDGKKVTTAGLGRRFSWYEFLKTAHPAILDRLEAAHDCGQEERNAIARILAERKRRSA